MSCTILLEVQAHCLDKLLKCYNFIFHSAKKLCTFITTNKTNRKNSISNKANDCIVNQLDTL